MNFDIFLKLDDRSVQKVLRYVSSLCTTCKK